MRIVLQIDDVTLPSSFPRSHYNISIITWLSIIQNIISLYLAGVSRNLTALPVTFRLAVAFTTTWAQSFYPV